MASLDEFNDEEGPLASINIIPFVDIVLVLDADHGAIVAPEAAVAEGQQGPYAFVVDGENKARLRRVTLKRRTESRAIVASGLSPGDRVVVDGLVRLKEGTSVSIKPDTPIKAENAAASGSGS